MRFGFQSFGQHEPICAPSLSHCSLSSGLIALANDRRKGTGSIGATLLLLRDTAP
jgi:hypothetical protein